MTDESPVQDAGLGIIVVGSFFWDNRGAVTDAIIDVLGNHMTSTATIITSGCPSGAELFANQLADERGWTKAVVRDEDMGNIKNAVVLGFIRDGSKGASRVLDGLSKSHWTRVYRDDTVKQLSAWTER